MWPRVIALIVASAVATVINIGPLLWHLKSRHYAIAALISWLIVLNIINFVNGAIWSDNNTANWWDGHGLCDIEVKIFVASYTGATGLVAYILRQLAQVVDRKRFTLVPTKSQKTKDLAFLIGMCWFFPLFQVTVHYVVQPSRYGIKTINGCSAAVDPSWLGEVLILIWLPIFCLVDCYYAVLVVVRMQRHRSEFASLLEHSNTNQSRYMRRLIMIMIITIILLPVEMMVYASAHQTWRMLPYSWTRVHQDWDVIPVFMSEGFDFVFFASWWKPVCGFVTFLTLGLGQDAMTAYKRWAEATGIQRLAQRSTSSLSRLSRASASWGSIGNKNVSLFGPTKSDISGSLASPSIVESFGDESSLRTATIQTYSAHVPSTTVVRQTQYGYEV